MPSTYSTLIRCLPCLVSSGLVGYLQQSFVEFTSMPLILDLLEMCYLKWHHSSYSSDDEKELDSNKQANLLELCQPEDFSSSSFSRCSS